VTSVYNQDFTIYKVTADWHELMVLPCIACTQSNPSMDDWDSGMSSAYTATVVAV